jgi:oxalate decarboxylase
MTEKYDSPETFDPSADPSEGASPPNENDAIGRRKFLGAASLAVFVAAMEGPPPTSRAQDIQKISEAHHNESITDPGPENAPLEEANPNTLTPPPTDHGEVETFWSSFSTAHRRIQEGGWTRQVTVEDFPIAKEIAGVNMRLTAGGIRELHWHAAAEWAIMLSGNARITAIDNDGKGFVNDVAKNDLWFFPEGTPHSIQGLAPNGCEFLLVFDDGRFSEGNTTLISDWTRHTPPEVLAKNWGVPQSALESIYRVPPEGHYIFQRDVPPALEEDVRAIGARNGLSPVSFDFPMHKMSPTKRIRYGEVRIIDSRNFPVSTTIAAAHVIVKPGGLREDALASKRRRMAILCCRQRPHDGIFQRREGPHRGFQRRRCWIRATDPRPPHRKCRRNRSDLPRDVQG